MKKVITRFALPYRVLHIGNARTALINWLYARKYNGKFILRIDDTDITEVLKNIKMQLLEI